MTFTMRILPISPNKLLRMHWAKRRKLQDEIFREMWATAPWRRIGEGPAPLARVQTWVWWPTRRLDPDNLSGSLKLHLDSMKKLGLIRNDSPVWLDLPAPEQSIDRCDPRVTFTITYLRKGGAK